MAVERLKRCENIVALSEELKLVAPLVRQPPMNAKTLLTSAKSHRQRTRANPRSAKRSAS